jgi:hypothetical protein
MGIFADVPGVVEVYEVMIAGLPENGADGGGQEKTYQYFMTHGTIRKKTSSPSLDV